VKIVWMLALLLASVVAAGCGKSTPTEPSPTDLSGMWTGSSGYPNAPFQLALTQTGATLRGQYTDRLDRSTSVTGTMSMSSVAVVVDFGDAKLNLDGTVVSGRMVEGTMFTSALGNTRYPFTMTR
jgi:hypothetical protein